MNIPYLSKPTETPNGWQVCFAAQVFHRPSEDWLNMRWGFNAAALLDEALDRQKLFLESQAVNEEAFLADEGARRALTLRGINQPNIGAQMAILGKALSSSPEKAREEAQNFARNTCAIFPHDFLLRPAETQGEYERLAGTDFFSKNATAAQIRRANARAPSTHGHHLTGLWQSSTRAHEQVWRALSNTRQTTVFNVVIQPAILYEKEKEFLLKIQKEENAASKETETQSDYAEWAGKYVKRRLAAWQKFFLLQTHVLIEGAMDNDLLRAIGAALTRSSGDMSTPGFQITRPDSAEQGEEWRENLYALELVPSPFRADDLADLDETFSVFRFPYLPAAGLPNAKFVEP
ncbi:MAG: hypothetical protein PHQ36_13730 [Anaerolineales bacterium]|nr:hypothetical protein [Anaerolineales bacterium]